MVYSKPKRQGAVSGFARKLVVFANPAANPYLPPLAAKGRLHPQA